MDEQAQEVLNHWSQPNIFWSTDGWLNSKKEYKNLNTVQILQIQPIKRKYLPIK